MAWRECPSPRPRASPWGLAGWPEDLRGPGAPVSREARSSPGLCLSKSHPNQTPQRTRLGLLPAAPLLGGALHGLACLPGPTGPLRRMPVGIPSWGLPLPSLCWEGSPPPLTSGTGGPAASHPCGRGGSDEHTRPSPRVPGGEGRLWVPCAAWVPHAGWPLPSSASCSPRITSRTSGGDSVPCPRVGGTWGLVARTPLPALHGAGAGMDGSLGRLPPRHLAPGPVCGRPHLQGRPCLLGLCSLLSVQGFSSW